MVMGKAKPSKAAAEGARCRRHPRHRQGAGVCAFCLRERLSRLSLSASLPSVVRGEEGEASSSSSAYSEASTAYSSEASTGCSSAAAASSGGASPGSFHDVMRRAGRVSLLMGNERIVGDADAVAAFLQARRDQRRKAATSFWAKLLQVTRGGGAKRRDDGCSLTHSKTTTLQERVAAAKWVLF